MNRLQKKCFFASTGFHLLLVVIVFIGPGFLSSRSRQDNLQPINFIPSILIEDGPPGGGSREAAVRAQVPQIKPAPPAQPQQAEVKQPVQEQQDKTKEPVREKAKETAPPKDDPESLEPVKNSKRRIEISDKVVTRNSIAQDAARVRAATEARAAKEAAAQRARLLAAIGQASSNIREGLSSGTKIDIDFGPGGGGPSYASCRQAILSAYDRVWDAPEEIAGSEATVTVSVTINKDGTVASSRITRASGDSRMDNSVRRALDRVDSIGAPLPGNDRQRTFEFDFKSRSKLSLG